MLNFCKKCQAVYECDYPLDECENILCDGEIVLMDELVFKLYEAAKGKCCELHLGETADILGSVYFYDLFFCFCDKTKAEDFFAQLEATAVKDKYDNTVCFEFCQLDHEPYVISVGISDCYDDFLYMNAFEKLDAIFRLVMFLCEVLVAGDREALSAIENANLAWKGESTGEI